MQLYKLAKYLLKKYPKISLSQDYSEDSSDESDENHLSNLQQVEDDEDNGQHIQFNPVTFEGKTLYVTNILEESGMTKGVCPPNWKPIGGSVTPEAGSFARYALQAFTKYYGPQSFSHHFKSLMYMKSKDGTLYAGRFETHQHQNATEYGGAGKGGALMRPHSGVTVYKVVS